MQPRARENSCITNVRAYVDAHVHIHPCFDIQEFLDAAAKNFLSQASRSVNVANSKFVLCLTDTYGTDNFSRLGKQAIDSDSVGGQWAFVPGAERASILASHPNLGQIEIIAGRQIVTAERLEILGLGLVGIPLDGQPTSEVVSRVIESGAIPILPWGFGKWLGARRQVVNDLIDNFSDGSLYLGDNSGRPGIMPTPAEFVQANELGMRILPGSDPLPFASEYNRAGSFGFYVDDVADREGVWTGLRAMLQQGDGQLRSYGSLESTFRFVRNQVAMQYFTRITNRRKAR